MRTLRTAQHRFPKELGQQQVTPTWMKQRNVSDGSKTICIPCKGRSLQSMEFRRRGFEHSCPVLVQQVLAHARPNRQVLLFHLWRQPWLAWQHHEDKAVQRQGHVLQHLAEHRLAEVAVAEETLVDCFLAPLVRLHRLSNPKISNGIPE